MSTIINASTSSGLVQTADTSGTLELQSNGTTQLTVASTGAYGQLKSGTAQAATSGTSIIFTSIPSWVKRITVLFKGVSLSGTSDYLVQIGAGSVTSTGYLCSAGFAGNGGTWSVTTSTAGFLVNSGNASRLTHGAITIQLQDTNTWVASGNFATTTSNTSGNTAGYLALGGTLDRVNITTVNGTDTFDAGSINILYEG